MRTYHFQDFNETLAEEWKDNGHNRLIFFRYFIHYGPEDPVGGADGHPNKVENHYPFGALLEALDLTPSLWHLEPKTDDHSEKTEHLINDATKGNGVPQLYNIHPDYGEEDKCGDASKEVAYDIGDRETLPPDIEAIQVHDGRCIGGIKQGTHDPPDVALNCQALPPVLRIDHDIVVREGNQADDNYPDRDK